MFQTLQQAQAAWRADRPRLEMLGLSVPGVTTYRPAPWKMNVEMAMDAQPSLVTDPTAGIPGILTTSIDPDVTRILFTPNQAAEIFGERRAGTWLDQTRMFPVVESVGEVSTYGDYANTGMVNANADWPNRQAYLYQVIKRYGDLEMERAGLAKLNWVSELDQSAATILGKFENFVYFFGVQGLQNYGLINDPNLGASITPALKAYGGTKWIVSGVVQATANEIYTDIQSIFSQMQSQLVGLINTKTPMVLAMSPASEVALTTTNTFNVNVEDLLKKNFPNLKVVTAAQYGQTSSTNTQGVAAGNLVQMIVETVDGQKTGFCAFNEKMKSFPIIRAMSSYEQKVAGGAWGSIIKMPVCIASMLGV